MFSEGFSDFGITVDCSCVKKNDLVLKIALETC